MVQDVATEAKKAEVIWGASQQNGPSIVSHQRDAQQAVDLAQCFNFRQPCHLHELPEAKLTSGSRFVLMDDFEVKCYVLISNWALGKTAACDISVTSPLNSNIMSEAGVTAGAAAQATELRKHEANDVKCSELGWLCIPLVVESYGAWGKEAMESFSSLASRLAITSSRPKSAVLLELYGRLNLNLKFLSNKIEDCQFKKLFDNSIPIDRAHLLSISSHHASAWLSVTPSLSMGLHLEPSEFQVAIKWWLGIPVAQGQSCSQCNAALDAYGHHALCCKLGGNVVSRHNRLRDIFNDFCHSACLAPQLEMGGWSRNRTRLADVLVPNWVLGKPAAFDLSVTSTLNAQIFQEACVTAGSAALAAQIRKHRVNDERCRDLGWACIPLVVETYGCWGTEAIQALSRLATHLSTRQGRPKSLVSNEIFGRLSLALVRANSRAILSRSL
eukprot:Em0006g573a